MQLCHHFAPPMAERGRGGIVLFGSAAGFAGAPALAAYGASKAFDMVFAEALWAELNPKGVDVLGLILGETDTPALRRLREQLGRRDDPDAPLAGAMSADAVVAEALAGLSNGPTCLVGEQVRLAAKLLGGIPRNDAVRLMIQASAHTMGSKT
jgi:short-subunit dehydrogenase